MCAATLLLSACGDDETVPVSTEGKACDTDAACLGGTSCCRADPADATGVCRVACSCENDADCEDFGDIPDAFDARCCDRSCVVFRTDAEAGQPCFEDVYCASQSCVFEPNGQCHGTCAPVIGGTGGGGAGGSGGAGGGLPPYTVISGSATTDRSGCLVAGGPGDPGVNIALSDELTGPTTLIIRGTLMPMMTGNGVERVSIVSTCIGGAITNSSVSGCHIGRATHNTLSGLGAIGVFDTLFNEVATESWTPTAATHDYVLTATSDTNAQTLSLTLEIDGSVVATTNASVLGAATGTVIAVLVSQGTICEVQRMP